MRARSLAFALLMLTAAVPAGAAAPPTPEGIWLGTLKVGATELRMAFHVHAAAAGGFTATVDSLSQSARDIPVDKVSYTAPVLRLELRKLGAVFEGKVDGDALTGTFTQGQSLPLSMKRVASLDPPKRPQEPKRPFPYREEEVSVRVPAEPGATGTVTLAGTLTIPEGKGPFPAVLLITGSGPEDRDETVFDHKPFLVLSDALTRAGVATLRFDDRGTGKSGGTGKGLTTLDFAKDASVELGLLAARPEVDRRAVGLIGHSEGGDIASIVAAESKVPRFLVLLAGTGMKGVDVLHTQTAAMLRGAGQDEAAIARARRNNEKVFGLALREPDPKKLEAEVRKALAGDPEALAEALSQLSTVTPWLRTFLALDPATYLKRVAVPVLALNGELDVQVDVANLKLIQRALAAGGNKQVEARALPGLNHLFQHAKTGLPSEYVVIEETFAPEALQAVRDYVLARAKAR